MLYAQFFSCFFFNAAATTEIYTLSLHDALPISHARPSSRSEAPRRPPALRRWTPPYVLPRVPRSEEHTSELQSRGHLVCRLLLEKKKTATRSCWTSAKRPRESSPPSICPTTISL